MSKNGMGIDQIQKTLKSDSSKLDDEKVDLAKVADLAEAEP